MKSTFLAKKSNYRGNMIAKVYKSIKCSFNLRSDPERSYL